MDVGVILLQRDSVIAAAKVDQLGHSMIVHSEEGAAH